MINKLPCFGKPKLDKVLISGCIRWREGLRIQRAGAEAIQIKGPQREEKGDNKVSGYIGFTNQGPAEG